MRIDHDLLEEFWREYYIEIAKAPIESLESIIPIEEKIVEYINRNPDITKLPEEIKEDIQTIFKLTNNKRLEKIHNEIDELKNSFR